MSSRSSQHILNTSSNLLGFCLVVLTSLKISKYHERTLIDEFTGVACLILVVSCGLSFLSIRTEEEKKSALYESLAENIFLVALGFVFIIVLFVAFFVAFSQVK